MIRGLLLERHGRRGVILTPDGQFRRVVLGPGWQVGDEVEWAAPRFTLPGWTLAAAAVVMLALAVSLLRPLLPAPAPVAFVYVDINPSVELALDAAEHVLRVRGVNAEGSALVADVDLAGVPLDRALWELTRRAVAGGYLSPAGPPAQIVLTAVPAAQQTPDLQALQERAAAAAQAATFDAGVAVSIWTLAGAETDHQAAQAAGISPARLAAGRWLQEHGVDVPPAEVRRKGAARLLEDHGVDPSLLLRPVQPPAPASGGKPGEDTGPDAPNQRQDMGPTPGPPATPPGRSDDKPGPPATPPGRSDDKPGPPATPPGRSDDKPGPPATPPGRSDDKPGPPATPPGRGQERSGR